MKIQEYKFGMFLIDNARFYDDVKIKEGKARHWEGKSRHELQASDVKDLTNCDVLVIGTGASGGMKVSNEAMMFLRENHVKTMIGMTEKTCEIFNKLASEGKKVNAILHATC